jgi:hypothetical protein
MRQKGQLRQMTALERYVRLESDGIWRPGPGLQRLGVLVSFGDATLVISDQAARPLAHWSLPALIRQNQGIRPAIYTPDDDASEELEIADELMIDAIEQVRKTLAKARPRPGKLRYWISAGVIGSIAALAIFWLPDALLRQALAIVPQAKRAEIGATILTQIETTTGAVCADPTAAAEAAQLAQRIFGQDNALRIVVVPNLAQGALAMPGGVVLLDGGLLRAADDPAAVAGYLLAARIALAGLDPLEAVLQQAGLGATLRLLTTGDVPRASLLRHANDALAKDAARPDPAALRAGFVAAALPQAPYLALINRQSGDMPDIGPDPLAGQSLPAVMTDSAWIRLQNICNR